MRKVIFIFAVLALSACHIGVKSDDKPVETANTFAHSVPGPSIDGVWSSGCDDTGFNAQKIVMTIKGQAITRVTQRFNDRDCVNLEKTISYSGQFRYKSVVRTDGVDKVFEVEYAIDLGNGVTSYTGENMKPTLSVLYISDFRVGDAAPGIPLVKTSGAKLASDDLDTQEFADQTNEGSK